VLTFWPSLLDQWLVQVVSSLVQIVSLCRWWCTRLVHLIGWCCRAIPRSCHAIAVVVFARCRILKLGPPSWQISWQIIRVWGGWWDTAVVGSVVGGLRFSHVVVSRFRGWTHGCWLVVSDCSCDRLTAAAAAGANTADKDYQHDAEENAASRVVIIIVIIVVVRIVIIDAT